MISPQLWDTHRTPSTDISVCFNMGQRVINRLICALVLFVFPQVGFAQSLQEKKVQMNEEETLASEVAYTNQVCGSDISASVDWQSFSSAEQDIELRLSNSCDAALSAIENLCSSENNQQAIKSQVDQVVCTKGTSRDVTLRQGTLLFQMNGPDGDDFEYIRDYLKKKISATDTE